MAFLGAIGSISLFTYHAEANKDARGVAPFVSDVRCHEEGVTSVTITGFASFDVVLLASDDMQEWEEVGFGEIGENGRLIFDDLEASRETARYYRACYEPEQFPEIANEDDGDPNEESNGEAANTDTDEDGEPGNETEEPSADPNAPDPAGSEEGEEAPFAWVNGVELPEIPLDDPVDEASWKKLCEGAGAVEDLTPLGRVNLDLLAHHYVALCVRVRSLQLQLRSLAEQIRTCQGSEDPAEQARCARLIRTFQAFIKLLDEAQREKTRAAAEFEEAKALVAGKAENNRANGVPVISDLTPAQRQALDNAKEALWKACKRLQEAEDALAPVAGNEEDCAKELADLQKKLDAANKAAKDAADAAQRAKDAADKAAKELEDLKTDVAKAEKMRDRWAKLVLKYVNELESVRWLAQRGRASAGEVATARALKDAALKEYNRWHNEWLRLRKLLPAAEKKAKDAKDQADAAAQKAKDAKKAAEDAKEALEEAKRRWENASKSNAEKEEERKKAAAAKAKAAKDLDNAVKEAEEQAEENRRKREEEEQERLEREREAAAAAQAEREKEIDCCLRLMRELGVQSADGGEFPEPGSANWGLIVKALTKGAGAAVGGKGISPVIPLGTFGVLEQLYHTIRAFFDPRTQRGKLHLANKLQQMKNKKTGRNFTFEEALAMVDKMEKLMNEWENLLKSQKAK